MDKTEIKKMKAEIKQQQKENRERIKTLRQQNKKLRSDSKNLRNELKKTKEIEKNASKGIKSILNPKIKDPDASNLTNGLKSWINSKFNTETDGETIGIFDAISDTISDVKTVFNTIKNPMSALIHTVINAVGASFGSVGTAIATGVNLIVDTVTGKKAKEKEIQEKQAQISENKQDIEDKQTENKILDDVKNIQWDNIIESDEVDTYDEERDEKELFGEMKMREYILSKLEQLPDELLLFGDDYTGGEDDAHKRVIVDRINITVYKNTLINAVRSKTTLVHDYYENANVNEFLNAYNSFNRDYHISKDGEEQIGVEFEGLLGWLTL